MSADPLPRASVKPAAVAPRVSSLLHDDTSRNRLVGIGLVSIAVFCFTALDAGAKWLGGVLPIMQVVWLRFLFQTLLSGAMLAPTHGRSLWRSRAPRLQLLRATMLGTMTCLNFIALRYLQLAETAAIFFISPILVALLAWWMLDERLDRGRWIAIVVGFAGVLLVLRPTGDGFHPAMLLSLTVSLMAAVFALLTRKLAAVDRAATTHFLSGLGATVALAPLAWLTWEPPAEPMQWAVLVLMGLAGGFGHYLLASAHRYAPASTLSPFNYTQIIWMIAVGYLVFGDVPSGAVVAGAAIVIASGLYLLWRAGSGPKAAH